MVFPTADSLQFNSRHNHLKQPMHRLPTVGAEGFCCQRNTFNLPMQRLPTAKETVQNCLRNGFRLPIQRLSTADATHFAERKSVLLTRKQHKRATHAFAPRPTEDAFHLTSQCCPHSNFQPREMTTKPPVPYIYIRARLRTETGTRTRTLRKRCSRKAAEERLQLTSINSKLAYINTCKNIVSEYDTACI